MPNTRARTLRWDMTDDERRLWALLRRKQLAGYRFRRQHPMGAYIADFFCPNAKLIVELDGGQLHDQLGIRKINKYVGTKSGRVGSRLGAPDTPTAPMASSPTMIGKPPCAGTMLER